MIWFQSWESWPKPGPAEAGDPRFIDNSRCITIPGSKSRLVPKLLVRLRVPLGFAFASWYLAIARPASLSALQWAIIFVVLGCLVRSWAAGYLLKGKRTAVGGPYAFIRNPLYVGSFLIGVGFCGALWQWPPSPSAVLLMSAFVVGFGVVYRTKTLAEEKELAENLGDPYRAYAARVPAFVPVRGHIAGLGKQRFSWEIYRRNREFECIIGSVAVLLYLFLRAKHAI